MKEFVNVIQCEFAAMGGFFGWVMDGFDGFLYALIVFMSVDYLTGLMATAIQNNLCMVNYVPFDSDIIGNPALDFGDPKHNTPPSPCGDWWS